MVRVNGVYRHFRQYNHRPVASHWQTLSHYVVSSTPRLSMIRTHNSVVIGTDCIGSSNSINHTITTSIILEDCLSKVHIWILIACCMSYAVVNLSLFVVICTARQGFLFCSKVILYHVIVCKTKMPSCIKYLIFDKKFRI